MLGTPSLPAGGVGKTAAWSESSGKAASAAATGSKKRKQPLVDAASAMAGDAPSVPAPQPPAAAASDAAAGKKNNKKRKRQEAEAAAAAAAEAAVAAASRGAGTASAQESDAKRSVHDRAASGGAGPFESPASLEPQTGKAKKRKVKGATPGAAPLNITEVHVAHVESRAAPAVSRGTKRSADGDAGGGPGAAAGGGDSQSAPGTEDKREKKRRKREAALAAAAQPLEGQTPAKGEAGTPTATVTGECSRSEG